MHALELLSECEPLIDILGERFIKLFIDVKTREANAFSQVVTSWEREHLLLTVSLRELRRLLFSLFVGVEYAIVKIGHGVWIKTLQSQQFARRSEHAVEIE